MVVAEGLVAEVAECLVVEVAEGDRAAGGFAVRHSSMTEGAAGRRSLAKGFAAIEMMLFFCVGQM